MIRRITKNNDLKDIIRSIPSDVINNINEVRYYVYGYENKFIAPEFTQEGDILKVIIPAEDLETLPDGLLYRQCFYNKADVDYPDGVYNLSITDNLELWIYSKENSVQPPIGSNYLQEDDLKTINGESLVGKGDIVIQTTAENIECGPVSNSLFNFSNVNEGLIQIAGSVEEINNTKENKKPVFYIDVDFDGPAVLTSYNDYLTIGAQIKQLGVDNVVLYVRDRWSGYICIPDVIEVVSQNRMTITGMAYTNNYRIYNDSSSLFIYFNSFVSYTQLTSNINDVKTWVVNQNYAKKTELKTINGESIVGSGDITIQATGGVTEEWLQNNLKTINGVSVVGPGDLFAPEPVYIGIDLDSEEFTGTYDEYKAVVSKYWNNSDTLKLVVGFESPSMGVWYESYPSDVYFPTEGKIEIGGYFLDDRDENNKRLIYYRIKGNDTAQKVEITFTPVPSSGDIPSLTGYATQEWVESKGYLTEHQSLADYALKSEIPDVSVYALKTEIPSLTGYATETWVESKGYLTEHQSLENYALKSEIPSLDGYALKSEIPSLDGYVQGSNLKTINGESIVGSGDITIQATGGVTEEWVTSQGYATETWVESKGYALKSEIPDMSGYALKSEIPSLTGYATETWVTSQGYTTQTYVDNKIGQIDTLLDQMLG